MIRSRTHTVAAITAQAITATLVFAAGGCTAQDRSGSDAPKTDKAIAAKPSPDPSVPAAGSSGWTMRADGVRGVHSVRVGMTSNEARASLGLTSASAPYAPGSCEYLDAATLPVKLYFMTESDTLVRIDVRDSTVATTEGARIGDTEARIKSLYGSGVRVEPHKYTGPRGHYLIVTPPGDVVHLIVFETDGDRVTTYRVGRKPAVQYVEGCG